MLETPISLHTTTAKITAISLIGPFRGGTVPRILSAALGLILGMLFASRKVNMKISLFVIAITVLGLYFLIAERLKMFGGKNLLGFLVLNFGYRFYSLLRIPRPAFSRGVMMLFPGLAPIGNSPQNEEFTTICSIFFLHSGGQLGANESRRHTSQCFTE